MKIRSLKYLTVEGLKNVWVNRLMSVASVGVLVACMLLMGAACLFSLNVDKALGTLQDQNVIMVYIKDGTDEASSKQVVTDIAKIGNVKEAVFVPKEEGLDQLLEDMGSGYSELFQWIEDDKPFLPDGVRVSFKDLNLYDQTINQIKTINNVESVNDAREVTQKITGMRQMINTAGVWVIGLLMITALVIIANTIRITMFSRKMEIGIQKAVGATNNFIRIPFVIEGMVLGIISACFSTGILYFAYRMIIQDISKSMKFAAVPFSSVAWWLLLLFCGIGILAGCIGSVISLGRYLRKEGSEFRAY